MNLPRADGYLFPQPHGWRLSECLWMLVEARCLLSCLHSILGFLHGQILRVLSTVNCVTLCNSGQIDNNQDAIVGTGPGWGAEGCSIFPHFLFQVDFVKGTDKVQTESLTLLSPDMISLWSHAL